MTDERITNYDEFFDFYLMEHRSPHSRVLHYLGTALGTVVFVAGLLLLNPYLLLLGLVLGYGPAWAGHFFLERNRPATFRYPLWSFISDYRMLGLWLTGRLDGAMAAAAQRRGVKSAL